MQLVHRGLEGYGRRGFHRGDGPSVASYLGMQRRRIAVLVGVVVLTSLLFAMLVFQLQFISAAVLIALILLVSIAWHTRVGLFVSVFLTCYFEPGNGDAMMLPGQFLYEDLSTSLRLTGVLVNTVELLLILTCLIWLGKAIATHRLGQFRAGSLGRPMYLFLGAIVLGLLRGQASGAPLNFAMWEVRSPVLIVICYLLACNTVKTRRDVQWLTAAIWLGAALFAIEGAYRAIVLISSGQLGTLQEQWYSHEDVVYLGTFMMLVVAQYAFGAPAWLKALGLVLASVAGYTLLASERRAGYIAIMVAFAAFAVVFYVVRRKVFLLVMLPIVVASAVYFPVFWNASGTLAQPARAVRSLKDPDPRDASSNLSRELEKTNIVATLQANPLLGVGWGNPYLLVVPIPDISWFPFWQHETHHNILWIWLKTGMGGFMLFWVVMASGIARSTYLTRTLRDPLARCFAMLTLSAIIMSLVFSYVDLGLTTARLPILLGATLGVLGVLERVIPAREPAADAQRAARPT